MDITTEQREATCVVAMGGSLDAVTADQALNYLSGEIREGRHQLVLDLSQLSYVSSAGQRVFLTAVKEARAQKGDVRLAAPQRNVRKVLEMAGFPSIIKIFGEVDEAITSYAG
jgi:anti-anti-sigma factor